MKRSIPVGDWPRSWRCRPTTLAIFATPVVLAARSTRLTPLALFSVAMLMPISAQAEKPRFGDTISLSAGGMLHRGTGEFASTRADATLDRLSFSDLGLSEETRVFWTDFTWQFTNRWQVSLTYTSFDADGLQTASESGNFDDLEWEIGARLATDFELRLYIADLTWDFLKTERSHLGLGVGVHAADLNLELLLEVTGSVDDESGEVEVRSEQASVLAPLPNLSLAGGHSIGDKLYLSGQLGYMSLSYDKYDGELLSARGQVEWRPRKNFGLGFAYQYVDIDITVEEELATELYDFRFYGPILFLSVGF